MLHLVTASALRGFVSSTAAGGIFIFDSTQFLKGERKEVCGMLKIYEHHDLKLVRITLSQWNY
jgi:hypothetical protein